MKLDVRNITRDDGLSLSLRRAWIEIKVSEGVGRKARVALLTESVD